MHKEIYKTSVDICLATQRKRRKILKATRNLVTVMILTCDHSKIPRIKYEFNVISLLVT